MNLSIKHTLARALVFSVGAIMALFVMVPTAFAEDPAGCNAAAIAISLTTYLSDGTTVNVGAVQSGQQLKYEAELSYVTSGGNKCNFGGGILTITTPDNVVHDVTPMGGIPLVSNGNPFVSAQVPYIVTEADVDLGEVKAITNYDGGTSYKKTPQTVSGSATDSAEFEDVSLDVSKTAVPAAEEGFRWTIDKTVTPATWDLFMGDSGTSEYTIDLEKISTGVSYSVSGQITIHNPALYADAVGVDVSDAIVGVGPVTVDCGVSLPTTIAAGGDLVCTYSYSLGQDATPRTNHVDVTTSGDVNGDSAEAEFDPATAIPVDNSTPVDVDDTFNGGDAGPFSSSGTYTYERTFTCGTEQGEYEGTGNEVDNTATIVQTQVSDDASVMVNCYDLEVSKTGAGTYDRTWTWDIEKSADQTELLLQESQVLLVNYEVTVDTLTPVDDNSMIQGEITIKNNHPTMAADIESVIDTLANVNCPAAVVPADDSIVCTYGPVSSDADSNHVTVTQQNYDYDKDVVPTDDGTTEYSAHADIDYTMANEYDECIDVTDTNMGLLGTVCAGDELPKTFTYTLEFSTDPVADNAYPDVVLECGDNTHPNTASFVTNDTDATGESSWMVDATVECQHGCTLTQGYWKTHSELGKAPYDEEGWGQLGDFDGDTQEEEHAEMWAIANVNWYNTFWTAPKSGNIWYKLAHQFQAAYLNVANGASAPTEVVNALASAEAWLKITSPTTKLKGNAAAEMNTWHGILASFNEGDIGPGHCDEDQTSDNSF